MVKKMFNPIKRIGEKVIGSILSFKEIADSTSSAPEAQLNALSQNGAVSDLLFYRFTQEIELEEKDEYGNNKIITLYHMDDRRMGIIYEVTPPVFLGEKNEQDIHQFFNSIEMNDVVVHINTFASQNIQNHIESFKREHTLDNANVRRRDILREIVDRRVEKMKFWVNNPMGKNGVKARNFVNTISVLFPYDAKIEDIVHFFIKGESNLEAYKPRDMKSDKLITVISEFLNKDKEPTNTLTDIHQTLNSQMASGARWNLNKDDGYMNVGKKWKAATLTTERFPKYLSMFEFQSAFFDPFGRDAIMPLSCPFICSLVVVFKDVKKESKKVLKKAQWNTSNIHFVPSKDEKKQPAIKRKRVENENIVKYILEHNEFPVRAQWSLTVFDESMNKLKRSCEEIKKKFREISTDGKGWVLKEESYSGIAMQSMLMGLPLQYSKIIYDNLKRTKILFKSNNSQIAPLIGGNIGSSKPWFMFPDRTGQLVGLNFYDSMKNYNVTVVGPPGTGKSVLANELCLMSIAASAVVRLVDIGDSYKDVNNTIGGKFVEFDDSYDLCFNFFTNILTKKVTVHGEEKELVHEDELCTIVPIIGAMIKMNLRSNASENKTNDPNIKAIVTMIEEAVQVAYERQGRSASMQTVWEYLVELRENFYNQNKRNIYELLDLIIIGLHDFVVRVDNNGNKIVGKNHKYFTGVNNVEFDSSYFVFEMEKLTKKGDDLLVVVSMMVLHQMANEAFFLEGVRKIIGVDEAKRLLKFTLFADFLDDLGLRLRKYGGILIIITQYIKHFFENKSSEALFEGASFNIFLEQEEESIDDAVDTGKLSMNDGQVALMKSVKARTPFYNEFMVKYGNSYTVLLNKLDPLSYWLYTTNPIDKERILDVYKRYNLTDKAEGAWFMSIVAEGKSEEEAYNEILEKRKISN